MGIWRLNVPMVILKKVISKMEVHLENSFLPIQKERFLKLISRDSKILVWVMIEHPLLHHPEHTIPEDSETSLWIGSNEIYHSGIWGWDQRTWREGRSSHRIPIRVWTRDVETRSRSKKWTQRKWMDPKRESRDPPNLLPTKWRIRWSTWVQIWVMKSCHQCSLQQDTLFRVRIQENKNWVFVCQDCLKIVKPDNPHYQYGGTWKNRKKK